MTMWGDWTPSMQGGAGVAEQLSRWVTQYSWLILSIFVPLVALLVFIYIVGFIIDKLRMRGVISRGVEQRFKAFIYTIALIIFVVHITSTIYANNVALSIAFVVALILFALYAVRYFIENLFSYFVVVLSGIVREGEHVMVRINNDVVSGVVVSIDELYTVISSQHNVYVFIPNTAILKSIVMRPRAASIAFKITFYGLESAGVEDVMRFVEDAIASSRLINRSSVNIRLVEARGSSVTVLAEAEVLNPRNVEESYLEVMNILRQKLKPYKVRIEVVSERERYAA